MNTISIKLSPISFQAIKNQIRKIWSSIFIGGFISFIGASTTVFVAIITRNPISRLTKDPADVLGFPPYIGLLSNIDVILWIATATICLFSGIIMKRNHTDKLVARFILASGIFSLILGIDDLFLFHDRILPRLLRAPEIAFYILYLIIIIIYFVSFLSQILQHEFILLAIAFFLFGVSRNALFPLSFVGGTMGDIVKYFGIVFWFTFFYRTSLHEIQRIITNKTSRFDLANLIE